MTDNEFEGHMARYKAKQGAWIPLFFAALTLLAFIAIFAFAIRWNIVWDRIQNGPYDMRFFN